jgi:hypothetical protein
MTSVNGIEPDLAKASEVAVQFIAEWLERSPQTVWADCRRSTGGGALRFRIPTAAVGLTLLLSGTATADVVDKAASGFTLVELDGRIMA